MKRRTLFLSCAFSLCVSFLAPSLALGQATLPDLDDIPKVDMNSAEVRELMEFSDDLKTQAKQPQGLNLEDLRKGQRGEGTKKVKSTRKLTAKEIERKERIAAEIAALDEETDEIAAEEAEPKRTPCNVDRQHCRIDGSPGICATPKCDEPPCDVMCMTPEEAKAILPKEEPKPVVVEQPKSSCSISPMGRVGLLPFWAILALFFIPNVRRNRET